MSALLFPNTLDSVKRRHMAAAPETIFATVLLGTQRTGEDYLKAIERNGHAVPRRSTAELLRGLKIATRETKLRVIICSVCDLGFKEHAEYREICRRAWARGLKLCRAEVALALCLKGEFLEEMSGEVEIAMRPLIDTGDRRLLSLRKKEGESRCTLETVSGHPITSWYLADRFAFVLPTT